MIKTLKKSVQTFQALPPDLSLLHKPRKHLRLHEDLQESPQALGGHGLTESLALEGRRSWRGGRRGGGFFITVAATHKERVMTHNLHEEAHECLRHHAAQRTGLYQEK